MHANKATVTFSLLRGGLISLHKSTIWYWSYCMWNAKQPLLWKDWRFIYDAFYVTVYSNLKWVASWFDKTQFIKLFLTWLLTARRFIKRTQFTLISDVKVKCHSLTWFSIVYFFMLYLHNYNELRMYFCFIFTIFLRPYILKNTF